MKITDKNYINIQGWMRTQLNLKGNELIVYALIYGFSQTEDQWFTGSLQYAADWCGASKQGIINNLKSLLDKKLIIKEEINNNGVKLCRYRAEVVNLVEYPLNLVEYPIQHSLTNNKVDNKANKEKTLSKDKVEFELNHSTKPKKPTLYDNCFNEILLFTKDESIRYDLVKYLKIRLKIQDKPLGLPGWKGLLKKLAKLPQKDWHAIIEQSVNNNWATFVELQIAEKKFTSKDTRPMYERELIEHGVYDNEDHTRSGVTF